MPVGAIILLCWVYYDCCGGDLLVFWSRPAGALKRLQPATTCHSSSLAVRQGWCFRCLKRDYIVCLTSSWSDSQLSLFSELSPFVSRQCNPVQPIRHSAHSQPHSAPRQISGPIFHTLCMTLRRMVDTAGWMAHCLVTQGLPASLKSLYL